MSLSTPQWATPHPIEPCLTPNELRHTIIALRHPSELRHNPNELLHTQISYATPPMRHSTTQWIMPHPHWAISLPEMNYATPPNELCMQHSAIFYFCWNGLYPSCPGQSEKLLVPSFPISLFSFLFSVRQAEHLPMLAKKGWSHFQRQWKA